MAFLLSSLIISVLSFMGMCLVLLAQARRGAHEAGQVETSAVFAAAHQATRRAQTLFLRKAVGVLVPAAAWFVARLLRAFDTFRVKVERGFERLLSYVEGRGIIQKERATSFYLKHLKGASPRANGDEKVGRIDD